MDQRNVRGILCYFPRGVSLVFADHLRILRASRSPALWIWLYIQCALSELSSGCHDFAFLHSAAHAPIISPLKPAPTAAQMSKDARHFDSVSSSVKKPACLIVSPPTNSSINFFCLECHSVAVFSVETLHRMYLFPVERYDGPLIHAILLSDCANDVSALFQGNHRSDEKRLRIVHSYLKDVLQYMNISYCIALFNLSDVGIIAISNLHIWRQFLSTCRFFHRSPKPKGM